MTFEAINWNKIEGLIDHQQEAVRVAAEVIAPHAYDKVLWRCTLADGRSMEQTALDAEDTAQAALTAAAPHIRADERRRVAEEIRARIDSAEDEHPFVEGVNAGFEYAARIAEGGAE